MDQARIVMHNLSTENRHLSTDGMEVEDAHAIDNEGGLRVPLAHEVFQPLGSKRASPLMRLLPCHVRRYPTHPIASCRARAKGAIRHVPARLGHLLARTILLPPPPSPDSALVEPSPQARRTAEDVPTRC